jgi:hypothetical protein
MTINTSENTQTVLWKQEIAKRLDRATHDIFDLVRWITIVGVTRFLWVDTGQLVFAILYWILAGTLFVFLAAQFLLRTEITVFVVADKWWKRFANHAANFMICVVAFVLTLWFVELLTVAFAARQSG